MGSNFDVPSPAQTSVNSTRRHFIALLLTVGFDRLRNRLALASLASDQGSTAVLRVGLTPAFLHDRHTLLEHWRTYLEHRLGRPVEFIQRDSYSDTMSLLRQQRLDIVWLCDYPYVLMKPAIKILAVPVYQGRPHYRSYLIVPAQDSKTRSIADLEGKVFAYADPYSHTGYLSPCHDIMSLGSHPETFFQRTFYTWSHRKAITAVASGLANGAAVDSYIWESLQRVEPELTKRTRVVIQSQEFGFPPFVAHRGLAEADFQAVQDTLLGMNQDVEGRALLNALFLDGFIAGGPELYTSVEEMVSAAGHLCNAAF